LKPAAGWANEAPWKRIHHSRKDLDNPRGEFASLSIEVNAVLFLAARR
jgi:hypothetical protein